MGVTKELFEKNREEENNKDDFLGYLYNEYQEL
jgi:hypothetical protein